MFRRDPYLWLHLTSFATLPLWLWVAWLGVAAGQPILPVTVEIFLLVTVAVVPWVWLQWTRPVNPFGIWGAVLQPSQLTLVQRQWLTRIKGKLTGPLAVLIALPMIWLVGQVYGFAPLAQAVTPVPNHVLGLGLGAIALFCANGMVQVSASTAGLLLTREAKFTATADYPVEQIRQDFLNVGLPVRGLLPAIHNSGSIVPEPTPPESPESPESEDLADPVEPTVAPVDQAMPEPTPDVLAVEPEIAPMEPEPEIPEPQPDNAITVEVTPDGEDQPPQAESSEP
ncbi:MAG: low-complexity tail membrane protein [Spirulina sp. DLM2.Bin59]|nr:MAG: low-complexity tail membrane protein [Spirulina sp. DLM2.Bin59]